MAEARVRPWRAHGEWAYVFEQLFDGNPAVWEGGVTRVKTWMTRGRVPLAVEATASFRELQLRNLHRVEHAAGSARSENELRLAIGMAIVRFVNGVLDTEQHGAVPEPMSRLAHKIALPQVFVDLRHDATHSQLPSLAMLVAASFQAVDWLRSSYWEPHLNAHVGSDDLRDLFASYGEARRLGEDGVSHRCVRRIQQHFSLPDQRDRVIADLVAVLEQSLQCELSTWMPLLSSLQSLSGNFLPQLLDRTASRIGDLQLAAVDADASSDAAAADAQSKQRLEQWCIALLRWMLDVHPATLASPAALRSVLLACLDDPTGVRLSIIQLLATHAASPCRDVCARLVSRAEDADKASAAAVDDDYVAAAAARAAAVERPAGVHVVETAVSDVARGPMACWEPLPEYAGCALGSLRGDDECSLEMPFGVAVHEPIAAAAAEIGAEQTKKAAANAKRIRLL